MRTTARRSIRAITRERRAPTSTSGCAPRTRRAGTKDAVERVWVLWAECDGAAAAMAARAYRPSPALIVASGSGPNLHAYWPLRQPLSPRQAEVANLRLARALGADEACHDAARILRPPATWNHKRDPPSPVRVLGFERDLSSTPRAVVAAAPEIDTAAHRAPVGKLVDA